MVYLVNEILLSNEEILTKCNKAVARMDLKMIVLRERSQKCVHFLSVTELENKLMGSDRESK